MQRCSICDGRTIQTEDGIRCMNANCEGSKTTPAEEGIICKCGQVMIYKGMNSWGEPNYSCMACGTTVKL